MLVVAWVVGMDGGGGEGDCMMSAARVVGNRGDYDPLMLVLSMTILFKREIDITRNIRKIDGITNEVTIKK